MLIEGGNNAVKNDNDEDDDDDLDEEQKLMKSMGLPLAFASDMLRIVDSDEETQVSVWVSLWRLKNVVSIVTRTHMQRFR